MALLEAIALTKFYGSVPAVREVTFRLEPGQVLGYLGHNGSGKSTTVKVLTGLLQHTHGQVLFEGKDIQSDLVSYRKRLGYVPEDANLYPFLTGEEYLEMIRTRRAMSPTRLKTKIVSLLKLFSWFPHRHVSLSSAACPGHTVARAVQPGQSVDRTRRLRPSRRSFLFRFASSLLIVEPSFSEERHPAVSILRGSLALSLFRVLFIPDEAGRERRGAVEFL